MTSDKSKTNQKWTSSEEYRKRYDLLFNNSTHILPKKLTHPDEPSSPMEGRCPTCGQVKLPEKLSFDSYAFSEDEIRTRFNAIDRRIEEVSNQNLVPSKKP